MRRILRDIGICIAFYTRLPMPRIAWTTGDLASAAWASPLAGAVVGLCGGAVYLAAVRLGLPAPAAAALALAATMLVTGALHEDGLADTADGFGGGRTREHKLEIMRDSRVGTYGACALVLSLLLRWSALLGLAGTGQALWALVAAHAAARSIIPPFMRWTCQARSEGLAAGAGAPPFAAVWASALIGFAALSPFGPRPMLIATALLLLWWWLLRRTARRQVGGQTGDVLGCLEQGGEIIVLLTIAAFVRG